MILKKGRYLGFLVLTGAGKTTIISSIMTLEKPTSGHIRVFGQDVQEDPLFIKSQIGYVPQELINYGYFNLLEILQFYSGYFGYFNNNERIDYLMHRLGLWEHRFKKVRQMSGGMKRRLLVAKALTSFPRSTDFR